jgi:hypothetical protein
VRLRLLNRVVTTSSDEDLRPLGLKVRPLNILIVTAGGPRALLPGRIE